VNSSGSNLEPPSGLIQEQRYKTL